MPHCNERFTLEIVALDELFDAILTLENREECYEFFDDLCTVNEIQSLSQRLQVAKMIKQGYTYATIEKETGGIGIIAPL